MNIGSHFVLTNATLLFYSYSILSGLEGSGLDKGLRKTTRFFPRRIWIEHFWVHIFSLLLHFCWSALAAAFAVMAILQIQTYILYLLHPKLSFFLNLLIPYSICSRLFIDLTLHVPVSLSKNSVSPEERDKKQHDNTSSSSAESAAPGTPVNHIMVVGFTVTVVSLLCAWLRAIIALKWVNTNCGGKQGYFKGEF